MGSVRYQVPLFWSLSAGSEPVSGAPQMQLHMWPIDYFFALFHFLAHDQIIEIPSDPS